MDNTRFLDRVEQIHSATQLNNLEGCLIEDFSNLGFEWVHLCNIYDPANGVDYYGHIGKMPQNFLKKYTSRKLYKDNPFHQLARSKTVLSPIIWPDFQMLSASDTVNANSELFDLVTQYGLTNGFSLALQVGRKIRFHAAFIAYELGLISEGAGWEHLWGKGPKE